ncbi:MAG TPA: 50S ribosomal protein L29 [Chthoniobacterales bacterium]|jgi:large subunit ribosomal protein L29|nr:50S ribosomal protein L29 [Chthoniobacterales bacterium]
MKIKELRELSNEELIARRRELRKDAFNLRLQQQTGALEKPSVIRINRREVARIETILTQRSENTEAEK